MTREKLIEVLTHHHDRIGTSRPGVELNDRQYAGAEHIDDESLRRHLKWMCRRCLDVFLPSGDPDDFLKAHVWLGYIQGELRALGVCTITQLRNLNRAKKGN